MNPGFEPKLCAWSFMYSLVLIIIYYPVCQRFFLLLEATEMSGEERRSRKGESRSGDKKYYELTK